MTDEQTLPDGVTEQEWDEAMAEALRAVRRRRAAVEETVFVRGEGGAVFEMAPSRMTADMRRRMRMGRLRRVTPDGRPYRAPHTPPDIEDDPPEQDDSPGPAGPVPRPAKSAPKKDWVLYAVAVLGVDEEEAQGMTRQELIELPADHAEHADTPAGEAVPSAAGGRPDEDAPKAAWIDYVARQGLLSRDDAEIYTRDDLIAMVS